jgi:CheY-like chemotaxis protein
MSKLLLDILLAEDSAEDAELTLGALSEHNLANRVVVVRDGAQALDYLHRRGAFAGRSSPHPVVFLLDLKMPKVNGLEVLRQMKEDPALEGIPVVMLSSSSEELDLEEAQRLGASAYVVKPVSFPAFVEAVKTIGRFWAVLNVLRPAVSESEFLPSEVRG